MAHCSIVGFSAPLTLHQRTLQAPVSRKTTTVCVLDQRRPVRTGPLLVDIKVKKASTPKQEQTSPFYEVLPDGVTEEGLERTPRHRNFPVFGFFIDNWMGKTPGVLAAKYGKAYRTNFLTYGSRLIVTDMDAITDIERNFDLFRSANSFDSAEAVFGPKSMFFTEGLEHAVLRRLMAPAFSPSVYPFFFDKICARVNKTWDAVEQEVNDKGMVLLDPILRRHYLSIVVEMTTGIDTDSDISSTLVPLFFTIGKTFFSPTFGPIFNEAMNAREELLSILENLIKRNIRENRKLLERLREYGGNLSYKGSRDIKEGEVNVLLIAIAQSDIDLDQPPEAHPEELKQLAEMMMLLWFTIYASSAAATSGSVFEMGLDASIWTQLVAEQDALVGTTGTEAVSYEQVNSGMPLPDSYINEILRLHPSFPGAPRFVTDNVSILGNHVKKGEIVFLDYKGAMRSRVAYPDPDLLKMDRFVRKEGEKPATRTISFGPHGAPHHCIGEGLAKILMRTTMAVLLRKYTLRLDPRQTRKYAVVPDDSPMSKVVVREFSRRG